MSLHSVVNKTRHSVDVDCTVLLNALQVVSLMHNMVFSLTCHWLLCVNLEPQTWTDGEVW